MYDQKFRLVRIVSLSAILLIFSVHSLESNSTVLLPCKSEIFCTGKLLHDIQMARLYNDSKTFVDMKMKQNADQVMKAFMDLGPNPTKTSLRKFVGEHFHSAGKDLLLWTPSDWKENASFINKIVDKDLREFGSALNIIWKKLGRNISTEARLHSNRSSLIVVDKPFIVPGGRFREYYYWDTFWTVEGLLVCEMNYTVRFMIDNFVQLVKKYGFVPNGGRIYYLNRSQPPFLIPIVDLYLDATDDFEYVKEILTSLEDEYDFWITKRVIDVKIAGSVHRLNHYAADMNTPRPESYYEDVHTASGLSEKAKADLYQDLASAAESGWDFSSRWFRNKSSKSLKSIRTRKVVPVDLNAFLYRNELTLEKLFKRAGDIAKANKYKRLAEKRRLAMEQVFWNEDKYSWLDYDLDLNSSNPGFYASSVVPFWAGLHRGNVTRDELVVQKLKTLKVLDYPGGVPTSLNDSSQQWDFPNTWAPLQYMAQEGMANSANENIKKIAFKLAQNWILTNYKGWKKTKAMYEKYDARVQGAPGGGGEYDTQVGFGWTNGVALHILKRYPSQLKLPRPEPAKSERVTADIQVLLVACAVGLIMAVL